MINSKENKIIKLYKKISEQLYSRVKALLKIQVMYEYKDYSIMLPANHLLPLHQKNHLKYDRFLPHLVRYMDDSAVVVDVGANVGDTLAGMVEKNSSLTYICIEPDDAFYFYLLENIGRIKRSLESLNVYPIKALVGKNISNVELDGEGGTKHAVIGKGGGIASLPLDKIIADDVKIRVLKSDVDGYDYDVLDSSMPLIEKYKPIIFFECLHDFEYQLNGYIKTINSLRLVGYSEWAVFDNFGELMLRTGDVAAIHNLMDYTFKQNCGIATRTIYYYDILTFHKDDIALMNKVLDDYLQID